MRRTFPIRAMVTAATIVAFAGLPAALSAQAVTPTTTLPWPQQEASYAGIAGSYLAARHASAARDPTSAASYFRAALKADPKNAELLELAFHAALADGDIDEAVKFADKITQGDRTIARNPNARLVLGVRALKQKQYKQARTQLSQAARPPVNDLIATLIAGWALLGANDVKGAIETIDQLTGPDWYAIFKNLHAGLILDLAGNRKEAGKRLEQAYQLDSTALRVVQAYASWLSRNGRRDDALKVYETFDAVLPRHPLVREAMETLRKGEALSSIVGPAGPPSDSPAARPSAVPAPEGKPISIPAASTPTSAFAQGDAAGVLTKLATTKKEKLDWHASIVDLMKLVDQESSPAARKILAKQLNYPGDMNDSVAMNAWLHKQLMLKLSEEGSLALSAPSSPSVPSIPRPADSAPRLADSASLGAAEALYGLGAALARREEELSLSNRGLAYLQLALYLEPTHALALLSLADLYEAMKKPELAIKVYSRVPENSALRRNADIQMALNLDSLDRTDEARAQLGKLIAGHPDDLEATLALGNILRERKHYNECADVYGKVIALIPRPTKPNWTVFYFRGICYERSKQWPNAEADLKKALELFPEQPHVLNYLGYSWIDQGINLDEGMRLIKRAVDQRPDDGYIVDSLGWAYYRIGNYEEALKHLERAVELKPMDPTINDHLGDVYWKADRKLEATFQWSHARDLKPEPDELAKIEKKLKQGLDEDPATSAEAEKPKRAGNGG